MTTWAEHQEWERSWWGDCTNTYGEETKQLTYAHRMGLTVVEHEGHWPVYDLDGRSVLDIGGGPCSMLLKTINGVRRMVIDPCRFPVWVRHRYDAADIQLDTARGEDVILETGGGFDEVWLYNCLQHTEQPEAIARNAHRAGRLLRVFEWIDMGTSIGHPTDLTAALLEDWFGPGGTVEEMNENGCHGSAWYGVFA